MDSKIPDFIYKNIFLNKCIVTKVGIGGEWEGVAPKMKGRK